MDKEINWKEVANRSLIETAKEFGYSECHIYTVTPECWERPFIQELLDERYDISFCYYENAKDMFIIVRWGKDCCGRVYNEMTDEYVSIENMYNI